VWGGEEKFFLWGGGGGGWDDFKCVYANIWIFSPQNTKCVCMQILGYSPLKIQCAAILKHTKEAIQCYLCVFALTRPGKSLGCSTGATTSMQTWSCKEQCAADIRIWTAGQIHATCIPSAHSTCDSNGASLGHLAESGKMFISQFIDSQLQTAAWLAHWMLAVRSMSARIKAIFISGIMSPWVREVQSAFYIRPSC